MGTRPCLTFRNTSKQNKTNKHRSTSIAFYLYKDFLSILFFFFYVKHWWSENGFLCALHFDLSPKDGDRDPVLARRAASPPGVLQGGAPGKGGPRGSALPDLVILKSGAPPGKDAGWGELQSGFRIGA